jgi:uncharacterized protein YggE
MEDTPIETRYISVTGEAEVKTEPDQVIIAFGVQTLNKQLGQAKEENDDIVKKLFAFAKDQGIKSDDIQTDFISIEPEHVKFENRYEFIGYYVRKSVVILLNDLSLLETILSTALELGVNYVHRVSFQTTKLKEFRDQARDIAIKAARVKAKALSQGLSLKLGKPLSIEEEMNRVYSWNSSLWGSNTLYMSQNMSIARGSGSLESGESIAAGLISITASVKVKFEIE